MPWSPVRRFPNIIRRLQNNGFEKEAPVKELKKAIIIELGVTNPNKIREYAEIMQEIGMIKLKGDVLEILKDEVE